MRMTSTTLDYALRELRREIAWSTSDRVGTMEEGRRGIRGGLSAPSRSSRQSAPVAGMAADFALALGPWPRGGQGIWVAWIAMIAIAAIVGVVRSLCAIDRRRRPRRGWASSTRAFEVGERLVGSVELLTSERSTSRVADADRGIRGGGSRAAGESHRAQGAGGAGEAGAVRRAGARGCAVVGLVSLAPCSGPIRSRRSRGGSSLRGSISTG